MSLYFVQTFGCQMNAHDSERIEDVLGANGYAPTDEPTLAQVLLFNTCSVREKAEHKLLSLLGTFRSLKESRPELVMVVAGCVAQQESQKLLDRVPYIDLVVGPDNIAELPALIKHVQDGGPRLARTVFDMGSPAFLSAVPKASPKNGKAKTSQYVTIMKGCDERCSFCIVPTTRGPERYRPGQDIVVEIERLLDSGVKEITLLGQTVNSWYEPNSEAQGISQFPALLRTIAKRAPHLKRLRYTSPHPRHVSLELIAAHQDLPMLAHHVHLPVQSGSDRILRRMIRRYTRQEYIERAHALLKAHPDMTLSTDIIVGFPGETEEDFQQTLTLIPEVGFAAAFAFKYSERPGTPSLKLPNDVPEEVKDERLKRLFEVVDAQQYRCLQNLLGSRATVLIEGTNAKNSERWMGRSERNEIVHVDLPPRDGPGDGLGDWSGELLEVTIRHANRHSLQGTPTDARLSVKPTPIPSLPMPSRVHLPIALAP